MSAASQFVTRKILTPSEMDSAQYSLLAASARERAFAMACVTDAKILAQNKAVAERVLRGEIAPAAAREQLRRFYEETGYSPKAGQEGTIKDLGTVRRMNATIKTNVAMAQGYQLKQSLSGNPARPGLELYRAGSARVPRNWQQRWADAGAQVGWAGASKAAMIALVESPIWRALSVFGQPYPPFDWGSHMDIKPVDYERCLELGLVGADAPEPPSTPEDQSFNADVSFDLDAPPPSVRKDLARELHGICDLSADKAVMRDVIGSRPYSWQAVGAVISTPNKASVPLYQAKAVNAYLDNPADFDMGGAADAVSKMSLAILAARIIGEVASGVLERAMPTEDADKYVESLRADGYSAAEGSIVEAWSDKPVASSGVVLLTDDYQSRKRLDGIRAGATSVFESTVRFDYLRDYMRDGQRVVELRERRLR